MQGLDKGLQPYQGRPLADWVLGQLASQCQTVRVSANRNLAAYRELLEAHLNAPTPIGVWPDDPDLPAASGPLAGILTALRHTDTEWLLVAPCDTPRLPSDLVSCLMQAALSRDADVVTPCTQPPGETVQHHWACALIRKRVLPQTQGMFVSGERKLRAWAHAQRWCSVSFADCAAFDNFNTLETLHGRP